MDQPQEDNNNYEYTLSEAWSGVNWADLMAAQGAFGIEFYDRSILRPMHRAYYRSPPNSLRYKPRTEYSIVFITYDLSRKAIIK